MRHALRAAAVWLALGAAPAAAQGTGSAEIRGGLSASGPAAAGGAALFAQWAPFHVGAEVDAAGLEEGSHVWHAGGAFRLAAPSGTPRLVATAGAAYYAWRRCAECDRLGLFGMSVGAGGRFVVPDSPLRLGADVRWHRQLQHTVTAEEMSFLTATLVVALEW